MNRSRRAPARRPALAELAELFLTERRVERGLKARTLADYRRSIAMFLATPGLPVDAEGLSKAHALLWTERLRERGLSAGAINAYQRPVWVWFRWLYANDYCPEDIPRRLSRVAVKTPKRRTATPEAHARMVTVALAQAENPLRDAAIVEVLWSAGPRRGELPQLNLADYDRANGTLTFRQTKTYAPRVSGVGERARLALERYIIKERGLDAAGVPLAGPLFVSRHGRRMTSDAIRCVIRKLASRAGVEASSHDFRRAAAANMLASGMELADVARQLGHARMEQTRVYGEAALTDRAVRAFHEYDSAQRGQRGHKRTA